MTTFICYLDFVLLIIYILVFIFMVKFGDDMHEEQSRTIIIPFAIFGFLRVFVAIVFSFLLDIDFGYVEILEGMFGYIATTDIFLICYFFIPFIASWIAIEGD